MLANSPPFDRQRQYPTVGWPSVLSLFPLALYRIYDGGSIYMLNGTGISVNKCVYLNIGDRKRITQNLANRKHICSYIDSAHKYSYISFSTNFKNMILSQIKLATFSSRTCWLEITFVHLKSIEHNVTKTVCVIASMNLAILRDTFWR